MKKKLLVLICFLSCLNAVQTKGQIATKDDYKRCLKTFYHLILVEESVTVEGLSSILLKNMESNLYYLSDDHFIGLDENLQKKNSIIIDSLRKRSKELTQGLDYEQLCKIVDKVKVIDEGKLFTVLLELTFPSKMVYYFEMNNDIPTEIIEIWLPNGISYSDFFFNTSYDGPLKRPGIINDPDGYTNIRNGPDTQSKIVGKIVKGVVFDYAPNSFSDWWLVFKRTAMFNEEPMGYIHKSRITPFSAFPKNLQKKVIDENDECRYIPSCILSLFCEL